MLMLSIEWGLNGRGTGVELTGPQERSGHDPVYKWLSDILISYDKSCYYIYY